MNRTKNYWTLLLVLASVLCTPLTLKANDSLRVEVVQGKSFVIHRVEAKETLYSIARRYKVAVAALTEANPGAQSGLSIGQELKVPVQVAARPQKETTTHKVTAKETLYSIARQYNVRVDELKKWNNLSDASLSVGQELIIRKSDPTSLPPPEVKKLSGIHVVGEKETLFSVAKMYGTTMQQLRTWNNLTSDELKKGQQLMVLPPVTTDTTPVTTTTTTTTTPITPTTPTTTTAKTPVDVRVPEGIAGSDEIHEKGIAALMEGTDGGHKYLALHKTLKAGSILKVRNEATKREVFVRVVGALPAGDMAIIRLSKSAFDRLEAAEVTLNVELIYFR